MKYEAQVREIEQKFEILRKEINDTRWLRDEARENYEDAVPRRDNTAALKKYGRQLDEHDAKLKELYERREQLHAEERNIRAEYIKTFSWLSDDELIKIAKERGLIYSIYSSSIIFKYFRTVGTDSPVRLASNLVRPIIFSFA